jgi:CheY-like chemotaxis protein
MPDIDGVAVIRAVQKRLPGLPAVLLTGYVEDTSALARDISGGQVVLPATQAGQGGRSRGKFAHIAGRTTRGSV